MKRDLHTQILNGMQNVKRRFYFIGNHLINLVPPARQKYAYPDGFLVMNYNSTKAQAEDEYLSVAQLSERYPAFSQNSIRWLIFNGKTNGFNKVVRKIGKKVILSLHEFKKFIEEQSRA